MKANIVYFVTAAVAGFAFVQIGLDTNFNPRMTGLLVLVAAGAYFGGYVSLWRQIRRRPSTVELILDNYADQKTSGRHQKGQCF